MHMSNVFEFQFEIIYYQECIKESTQVHTVVWHVPFD